MRDILWFPRRSHIISAAVWCNRRGHFEGNISVSRIRLPLLIAGAALVVLVGAFVALGLIDVAPQPVTVEKTIPNARFSN